MQSSGSMTMSISNAARDSTVDVAAPLLVGMLSCAACTSAVDAAAEPIPGTLAPAPAELSMEIAPTASACQCCMRPLLSSTWPSMRSMVFPSRKRHFPFSGTSCVTTSFQAMGHHARA